MQQEPLRAAGDECPNVTLSGKQAAWMFKELTRVGIVVGEIAVHLDGQLSVLDPGKDTDTRAPCSAAVRRHRMLIHRTPSPASFLEPIGDVCSDEAVQALEFHPQRDIRACNPREKEEARESVAATATRVSLP